MKLYSRWFGAGVAVMLSLHALGTVAYASAVTPGLRRSGSASISSTSSSSPVGEWSSAWRRSISISGASAFRRWSAGISR